MDTPITVVTLENPKAQVQSTNRVAVAGLNLRRDPILLGHHRHKDPIVAFLLVIQLATNALVNALDGQFKDIATQRPI
jgi:hypothetical protein